MYYSAIGLLAMLILLIENHDILAGRNEAFRIHAWKVYRKFLFAVLLYYVIDIMWGVLEYFSLGYLLFADTTVYFVAIAAGVLFWAEYTVLYLGENNLFGRFLVYAGRVLSGTIIALTTINIFLPVLFVVDKMAVYHPLPLRYALLITQVVFLLLIVVYAVSSIIRHKPDRILQYRTLALFGFIMATFLGFQLFYPYLPLYSIAYLLGTSLLHAFVTGSEKEQAVLRLKDAEKSAEFRKIVTSFLDNIPGIAFTKDAKSGEFLACNRAFAEFVRKKSPADVAGCTAMDLFDGETAARFSGDDRVALSMEEPYIFYEDLPDARGSVRQFMTTKRKYRDFAGRECLLGICQDVTDIARIQREHVLTREAYEKARMTGLIFNHIAQTLARGYTDLFYVNMQTGEFIEYRADDRSDTLTEARHSWHFFDLCPEEAQTYIYHEDREEFIRAMNRENLTEALHLSGVFMMTYRRLVNNIPVYVTMKISRMKDDENYIVIGVMDVDDQMRQQREAERMHEERIAYTRLNALSGSFLLVYIVDPDTGAYRELSTTAGCENIALPREGADFWSSVRDFASSAICPEDQNRFLSLFSKEAVFMEIESNGLYAVSFRIIIGERPTYVQLRAAMVEEDNDRKLIAGVSDVDFQVRQEEDYARRLSQALSKANIDALTGVKSKHAYLETEKTLNLQIRVGHAPSFAIMVLDVNDLKKVNDNAGHHAGDRYLRDACRIICDIFRHSPVYRIGGDEFVTVVRDQDYERIDELAAIMRDHNEKALKSGGIVIACGMARFSGDDCVADVFERADRIMYENKKELKAQKDALSSEASGVSV